MTSDEPADGGADPSGAGQGDGFTPESSPVDGTDGQVRADGGQSDEEDGNEKASLGRRIGLVVLGVVLAASLAGASGVFAAQSTVLDSGYVADTMADENVFSDLETSVESTILEEARGSVETGGLLPNSGEVLRNAVREVVTPSYVEAQTRGAIDRLYDRLHGRTSRLQLGIDPSPLVDGIADAVAAEVEEIPVPTLIRDSSVGESFGGFGIDADTVADAVEDRDTYRQLQSDVSQQVEQQGLTRDQLNESLRQETDLGDLPQDVKDSVYRMQGTTVVALTGDMPHDEYRSKMQAARDDLAEAIGGYAQDQFRQRVRSNDRLAEQVLPVDRQQVRTTAGTVQQADTMQLALPMVAFLVLVGVLGLTHSLGRTALVLGASLAAAGVLGFLASVLAKDTMLAGVRESLANAEGSLRQAFVTAFEGMFGQLTTQSLALLVAGLVFVGIWYAIVTSEPEQIPPEWR